MACPLTQDPMLERLDFERLRKLLKDLGIEVGYWMPGESEIQGLTICGSGKGTPANNAGAAPGGRAELVQLAGEAQAGGEVVCRPWAAGVMALAVRMDRVAAGSPVAVGVATCGDGAWLGKVFGGVVQDWYARGCEQVREVEVLSHSLADTYEELSANYRLSEAMNLKVSPRAYLEELANELRDLLAADAVMISLTPQGSEAETIVAGELPLPVERIVSCVDAEKMARRGYQLAAIDGNGALAQNRDAVAQAIYAPITRGERRLGVIAALRRGGARQVSNIDVTRMGSIGRSAATVLENFQLYDNLRNLFLGTVRALTQSIDAKDPYTCGHSERVAALARQLVVQMGGTTHQADRVYLCGLLHDIGKIGVPEFVLRKPGRLTEEEYAKIKRHPAVGVAILGDIQELGDVMPGVLHHHERIDGQGYPDGLSGEQIPLYARVLAVADTFDAMTSARPYRKALSVQVAVEELTRHAGAQFDPAVVEALLQMGPEAVFAELSLIHSGYRPATAEQAVVSAGGGR
jgi:HD-GYP domain-containing protein (c-di-GMP phosphodiesterase class II)